MFQSLFYPFSMLGMLTTNSEIFISKHETQRLLATFSLKTLKLMLKKLSYVISAFPRCCKSPLAACSDENHKCFFSILTKPQTIEREFLWCQLESDYERKTCQLSDLIAIKWPTLVLEFILNANQVSRTEPLILLVKKIQCTSIRLSASLASF